MLGTEKLTVLFTVS